MSSNIEQLIQELNKLPRVAATQVEPLSLYAEGLDDASFVEFLQGLPTRLVQLLGEISPTSIARLSEIVKHQEIPDKDDNRYEFSFDDDGNRIP